MNLIDFSAAQTAALNVENQAVKDITTQIIPVIEGAANELLTGAQLAITGVLHQSIEVFGAMMDAKLDRFEAIINSLKVVNTTTIETK